MSTDELLRNNHDFVKVPGDWRCIRAPLERTRPAELPTEVERTCCSCGHKYTTGTLQPWPCPECGQEAWPAVTTDMGRAIYIRGWERNTPLVIDILALHHGWTWGVAHCHDPYGRPLLLYCRGDSYATADGARAAADRARTVLLDWRTWAAMSPVTPGGRQYWLATGTPGVGGWTANIMPTGERGLYRWFLARGDEPLCMGPPPDHRYAAEDYFRRFIEALERNRGELPTAEPRHNHEKETTCLPPN